MTMRDPLVPVQPDDVQLALLSLPDRLTAILEKLEERAALEAAVAAEPPPLEEPTGLGAVVRDIHGRSWVRLSAVLGNNPWYWAGYHMVWGSLVVAEILSGGYDNDGDQ